MAEPVTWALPSAPGLKVKGTLTGALDGPNCRAGEKVRRLDAWLGTLGLTRDDIHLTAYGDSTGDRELLLDADEPHWVGRGDAPSWMPRP